MQQADMAADTNGASGRRDTRAFSAARCALRTNRCLPWLFLALGLPISSFFALTMPPSFFADEQPYIIRAAGLLRGEWFGYRAVPPGMPANSRVEAGVDAAAGLLAVSSDVPTMDRRVTAAEVQRAREEGWGTVRFIPVPNTVRYFPVFFLPAAAGLGIAKAVGASPFAAVLTGRLVALAGYQVLGVLALLLATRGRALLFCMLMLPTSLALAGSFNVGGLVIATMALAIAWFTRALTVSGDRSQVARSRSFWAGTVALSGVILMQPPYLPAAALVAIPLPWRRGGLPERDTLLRVGAALAACLLPAILWSLLIEAFVATPFGRTPYLPGPLYPGDPHTMFTACDAAAQMRVLLAHPLTLAAMTVQEFVGRFGVHLNAMIGILGMLNVILPAAVYRLWQIALLAGVVAAIPLRRPAETWLPRPIDCVLPLIAGMLCIVAIVLSQYLTWTPVGATAIEGVQGRYFVPLLGLLALALPRFSLSQAPSIRAVCLAIAIVAATLDMLLLPAVMVGTYYLH